MAAVAVVMTVLGVGGLGVGLAVLYLRERRRMRRDVPAVARIRLNGRGFVSLGLLVAVMTGCACAGLLLAVYAGVPTYAVGLGLVLVVAAVWPVYRTRRNMPFALESIEQEAVTGELLRSGRHASGGGGQAGAFPKTGVGSPAGQVSDADVYANHRVALERGETRHLFRTATGAVHSYAPEELGFPPEGAPHRNRPTTWRMGLLILSVHVGFIVLGLVTFLLPMRDGVTPNWWLLAFIVVAFSSTGYTTLRYTHEHYRAEKLRKARGVPTPGRGAELSLPT